MYLQPTEGGQNQMLGRGGAWTTFALTAPEGTGCPRSQKELAPALPTPGLGFFSASARMVGQLAGCVGPTLWKCYSSPGESGKAP